MTRLKSFAQSSRINAAVAASRHSASGFDGSILHSSLFSDAVSSHFFTNAANKALQRTGLGAVDLFGFDFIMIWFQLIDRLPSPSLSLGR